MRLWRSVVGKLWATILLLVSLVLMILTILLVEFFGNFQIDEVENNLMKTAKRIVEITNTHENTDEVLQIASEMIGIETKMLVLNDNNIIFSSEAMEKYGVNPGFLKNDPNLIKVFTKREMVKKELLLH